MTRLGGVPGRLVGLGRPRSLGAKLVLILTGIGLAGAAAIALLLAVIITPSFDRLEDQAITGHVDRTHAALAEYASKVEATVRDYGDWTDSYNYMARQTRAFEQDSFSTLAMANLEVQAMAYIAPGGKIVISRWIDPTTGLDDPAMQRRMMRALAEIDLDRVVAQGSSARFYMRIGHVLAAIGVAQVRRSDGTGTPRGHVVMARVMDSEQLAALIQLPARLVAPVGTQGGAVTASRDRIDIAVPVPGHDGRAVASATYAVPRDLSALGRRMLLFAVAASVLLLLLVLVGLKRMIARQVLRPLGRVERHMQAVRASSEPALLPQDDRSDEIGSLVASFNSMLRQLNEAREQLELQSFKLGRQESAVAVMHNVRNALNPISTILSQGLAVQPGVDRATVDRAIGELAREEIPAVRRQKLAAFVAAAAEADAVQRVDRRRQMEIGREALQNVLEIIGKQQADAHERPQLSPVNLSDIVAQNATIARYSGGSSIAFSFPSAPHWALANRVLLSQVIGNLFSNAAEAIAASGREGGSITVAIRETADRVELLVRDDGDGFDPRQAPVLFQRGYSTRAHKSGGLGLHWCANSMVAIGGTLRLESEGRGLGAVAILTLPAVPAETLTATGLAA